MTLVATPETSLGASAQTGTSHHLLRRVVAVFKHRPFALGGLLWMALVVVAAVFASQISPYDPNAQNLLNTFAAPSWHHLLGTDNLGRDTLSRVIFAGRVALPAAALGVGVAVGIGVPVGLAVGYAGGLWDRIAMRLVDAILALPGLVLAIAVIGSLGPSLDHAMITLGLLASAGFARLSRGVVLAVREQAYVDAARVTGQSTPHILVREVLPNAAGPIVVQATLAFAHMLLFEAALSFIGLGVQPPQASWGSMLTDARAQIGNDAFLAVPPGLAILLTVLAAQLIGDALRSALVRGRNDYAGSPRPTKRTQPAAPAVPRQANAPTTPGAPVLSVAHLRVVVDSGEHPLTVVDDVSLSLDRGETIGLVGESGCGKSMTALSLMRLLPAAARITEGQLLLKGRNLLALSEREMDAVRGNEIGMIFQDPKGSLDPAFSIGNQVSEPLRLHRGLSRRAAWKEAVALLERVRLPRAAERAHDYPHQLSGGQLQRVMIAAALACSPDVLIADEPTTALDVTVQGKLLDLLAELRGDLGMAMVFVSHDLGVVADICDKVIVMYAGQVVESAEVHRLFARPAHPYTERLLKTLPEAGTVGGRLARIPGQVPPPELWPTDRCRFADRCAHVAPPCNAAMPELRSSQGSLTRCVRADELLGTGATAP